MSKNKTFFTSIKNTLVNGGLTKEQYQSVKKEIEDTNHNLWNITYILSSIIFLFFFVISFFIDAYKELRYVYMGMFIYLFVITLINFILLKRNTKLRILFRYISYVCLLFFGVYSGIYTNGFSSFAFYSILLIISLLILDRPIIVTPIIIIISFSYGILNFFFNKTDASNYLITNLINSILYGCLAAFINIHLSRTRFRELYLTKQVEYERDTDSLSTLYTKQAGTTLIDDYLAKNSDTGIMLFVDIDDFKKINDSFGHDYGDQIINKVSEKIKSVFKENSIALRFGGDEFIVFMKDTINLEESIKKAEELLKFHNDITFPNGLQSLYLSVGIALREKDDNNYHDLINKADLALYKAKKNGKNQYQVYDSTLKKD